MTTQVKIFLLLSIIGIEAAIIENESLRQFQKFGKEVLTYFRHKDLYDQFVDKPAGRSNPVIVEWQNGDPLAYPKVNTTSGPAVGVTADDAHAFYEIPYAEPPVGTLRLQDPQPIKSPRLEINATLNNNLKCHQYSNPCAGSSDESCPHNINEDCLVLSVFVPRSVELSDQADPVDDRLPVMFYIHGGSYKNGAGTDKQLDGKELSNVTNSIVVATNYRLGALGFLVHKETGKQDISGNQGLKDQRLALRWVQDNIAAFGGDNTRVTIFGTSAGGQSVLFHTVSALSEDLYSFSIQQSTPHIYSLYYPDVEASLRISDRLVNALGCNITSTTGGRQCMLDAPAQDIMDQMSKVEDLTVVEEGRAVYSEETFMPVIDGIEFTALPWDLYREGKWHKDKPMIIGVQTEEYDHIKHLFPKDQALGEETFLTLNLFDLGEHVAQTVVDKYKEAYPPQEGEDYRVTYGKEISHYIFDCPNRRMARYASNTTTSAVYFYTNSHPVLNEICFLVNGGNKTGCYAAYHGAEYPYVFRTMDEKNEDYGEEDRAVEDEFSTYWGSFARTGNPSNGLENSLGSFADWTKYTADISNGVSEPWQYLHITAPTSSVEHGYKEDICDFWDDINYGIPVGTSTDQPATTTPVLSDPTTTDESLSDSTTTNGSTSTNQVFLGIAAYLVLWVSVTYATAAFH